MFNLSILKIKQFITRKVIVILVYLFLFIVLNHYAQISQANWYNILYQ